MNVFLRVTIAELIPPLMTGVVLSPSTSLGKSEEFPFERETLFPRPILGMIGRELFTKKGEPAVFETLNSKY